MRAEYINPFLVSTSSVFSQMLGINVTRQAPFIRRDFQPQHDVTGIIGLTGKTTATVAVSVPKQMALTVTGTLLGETPDDINNQVVDAVGEITNMVAGGAKAQLESLALNLGLPTVIIGKSSFIAFPSAATPMSIPFDCPLGAFVVEVGIMM